MTNFETHSSLFKDFNAKLLKAHIKFHLGYSQFKGLVHQKFVIRMKTEIFTAYSFSHFKKKTFIQN